MTDKIIDALDNKRIYAAIIVLSIAVSLLIAIPAWYMERWLNWKFSYGPKVEERIQALEQRVERLEHPRKVDP